MLNKTRCGWTTNSEDLDGFIQKCEADNEYSRAAAVAVFCLQLNTALQAWIHIKRRMFVRLENYRFLDFSSRFSIVVLPGLSPRSRRPHTIWLPFLCLDLRLAAATAFGRGWFARTRRKSRTPTSGLPSSFSLQTRQKKSPTKQSWPSTDSNCQIR